MEEKKVIDVVDDDFLELIELSREKYNELKISYPKLYSILIGADSVFLFKPISVKDQMDIEKKLHAREKELTQGLGLSEEDLEVNEELIGDLTRYASILYCEKGCVWPEAFDFNSEEILPGIVSNLSYRIQEFSGLSDQGLIKKV